MQAHNSGKAHASARERKEAHAHEKRKHKSHHLTKSGLSADAGGAASIAGTAERGSTQHRIGE